jgi:hypothetical protein
MSTTKAPFGAFVVLEAVYECYEAQNRSRNRDFQRFTVAANIKVTSAICEKP